MKEEIKEILEFKENADYKKLSVDEIAILEDCITNLQEEIERQSKAQVILDNQIAEMYDYKLRNEKAIEILKLCNSKCAKETISILKGDKDE